MNLLPDNLTVRPPMWDDLPAVLALAHLIETNEHGEPDTSLDELKANWSEVDLNQNIWLVHTAAGQLVGYALATPEHKEYILDFYVHPDWLDSSLPGFFLAEMEQVARAHPRTPEGSRLKNYMPDVAVPEQAALRRAGFTCVKHHFRMQIELAERPPEVNWPEGLTLRTIQPGVDDAKVFELVQHAFTYEEDDDGSRFTSWRDYMMRPDHFSPELWFLLEKGDELVACALCYDYEVYGWVRQLAVREVWRGRGLASTLLQHIFRVFYQRGLPKVALGVNATNLTALRLYQRLGMKKVRQYDEFHKQIENLSDTDEHG